MMTRSSGKAKTLFIYPGSDNPYINVRGLKGEPTSSDSSDFAKFEMQAKSSQALRIRQLAACFSPTRQSEKALAHAQSLKKYNKQNSNKEDDEQPLPPTDKAREKVFSRRYHRQQSDALREQNKQLTLRVAELEAYFQKIGLRPCQPTNTSDPQNLHLKILLQQQKISSLIYMIKQYRVGNKSQTQNFQRRLLQFQPTLQPDLTEQLAAANRQLKRANQALNRMKALYQSCEAGCNGKTWENLVEKVGKLQGQLEKEVKENRRLQGEVEGERAEKERLELVELRARELQQRCETVDRELSKCREELGKTEGELEAYRDKCEQMGFEIKAKQDVEKQLEEKLKHNQQLALQLSRLQSENITLKNKLSSISKDFNDRIFKQISLVAVLSGLEAQISANSSKFTQNLTRLMAGSSLDLQKEQLTYLSHLFSKNQTLHDRIITDYRTQLQSLQTEAENASRVANGLKLELERVASRSEAAKLKTQASVEKLGKYIAQLKSNRAECQSCESARGYYGQMAEILGAMVA